MGIGRIVEYVFRGKGYLIMVKVYHLPLLSLFSVSVEDDQPGHQLLTTAKSTSVPKTTSQMVGWKLEKKV